MSCQFCGSQTDVQQKSKFAACRVCLKVQKRLKHDSGVYFDVLARAYRTGDEVRAQFATPTCRRLVLDLHGVTDLLSMPDFAQLTDSALAAGVDHVVLLSYVGTTTQTRIEAQTAMEQYVREVGHQPLVSAFVCFHRGDTVEPSNKGHFVQMLHAPSVLFFDDSTDHVSAAQNAGADAHHVMTEDPSVLLAQIRAALRGELGQSVNDGR